MRLWREKAFPREKPPPAPSRKAYRGKGIFVWERAAGVRESLFVCRLGCKCGLLLLLFFWHRRKEGPPQGVLLVTIMILAILE